MYIYIPLPLSTCKGRAREEAEAAEEEYIHPSLHPKHHTHLVSCLRSRRNLPSRKKRSMGGFSGATAGLPVYREYDDEELFETSSSISGDSDDEDQFSDGEGGALEHHQFLQQAAPSPAHQSVRRLNSESLYDLSSMMAQLPVK